LCVGVRVQLVDPSAYTPPYDHALAASLAATGAEVELITSRFAYGPVPAPDGYLREERFYNLAAHVSDARLRRAVKLAEHVPDMLRYRAGADAEVIHFQWLTVQHLDRWLLPRRRPGRALLLTAHDVLPREARPGQRTAQQRLYDSFDAIVVHTEHGRRRLTEELGVDADRVHVIPHGVFAHLAEDQAEEPPGSDRPIVLCFGLMRPYKGIDVLLDAWRGVEGAELWIVGMPRMDVEPLRAKAPPGVRFVTRFVGDDELAAHFRAASLVVLPYREADQSGVLFTALAFGRPLLLSDVGGFPEMAATGAARIVPAGDPVALHDALVELLNDPSALREMASRAEAAGSGEFSWERIAQRTRALYERLLG
jgi:glycosyltransferase involved in cell wall biosynthesis